MLSSLRKKIQSNEHILVIVGKIYRFTDIFFKHFENLKIQISSVQ